MVQVIILLNANEPMFRADTGTQTASIDPGEHNA